VKKRAGAVLALSLFALLLIGDAAVAQYPPPTPTRTARPTPPRTGRPTDLPNPSNRPSNRPPNRTQTESTAAPASCLVVRGEDDDSFVVGTADFRSQLEVEGGQGCAPSNGDITVTVFSDPVVLGTFQAFEDGSFHKIFCLPPAVEPGSHNVQVNIEDRGVRSRPLIVDSDNAELCGPGDGTVVAGTSETNDGSGGGTLPRTGAGILLLLLWAVVLLGLGTVLVMTAWRYRARLTPAYVRTRLERRSHAPVLALPAPEIPRIDTSRFVPYRSRVERAEPPAQPGPTLTEWDAAPPTPTDSDHPWA
jgi:hypothetical protein